MHRAVLANNRRCGALALATAVLLACLMGLLFAGTSEGTQAYAADANTQLNVQTSSREAPLFTAAVKKAYLTKQKMTVTMADGDSTTIAVNKTGSKVKWANSNKKVVLVKPSGTYAVNVIALKPGEATITVKNSKQKLTCKVVVTGALNRNSVEMTPLQTGKLTLAGATAKRWASSNASVVTVGSCGNLEPQSTGRATVTCVDSKGRRYTCSVAVKCPKIVCSMGSTNSTTINNRKCYVRDFQLTNKSGKDLTFDKERVTVYPKIASFGKCSFFGFDPTAKAYFDSQAVTVKNGASYSFSGISTSSLAQLSSGSFKMHFKVGDARYCGVFRSTGAMLACRRMA